MSNDNYQSGITHHVTTAADVPELANRAAESITQHVNAIALNKEFGLAQYDRRSSMSQIQFHLRQSAESMLEAGRLLIQMRENEEHGQWLALLSELNIDVTLARRLRKAAVKFSNAAATPLLISAAGNKTKLFELMILDDEDITELEDGGTVAGLKLDDVARMSTSELRKALRSQREKTAEIAKAKDDVIQGKSKFIDHLEEKLATALNKKAVEKPEAMQDTRIADARSGLQEVANQVKIDIMTELRKAVHQLIEDTPGQHVQLAAGCLIEIGRELTQLRDDYNLPAIISDTAPLDATWAAINAEQDDE